MKLKTLAILFSTCWLLPCVSAEAAEKSYKAAITAKELLVMMSACDLISPAAALKRPTTTLTEMCGKGKRLLRMGMSVGGPGPWTWQPGKMTDHDDFRFAGNLYVAPDLVEKKVPGISLDSAHFYTKWPLFFRSAKDASTGDDRLYFEDAITGLVQNLKTVVVSKDTVNCLVRYRNYIDGTNGVYRWNWQGRGVDYGFSAYQLTWTPFVSSTAVLDDAYIAQHYKDIDACYPYSKQEIVDYLGYRNVDRAWLLVRLSSMRPTGAAGYKPTTLEANLFSQFVSDELNTGASFTTTDAYEAVVGIRMLIMHYAFFMGNAAWQQAFATYAKALQPLICIKCVDTIDFYDRLHLIYFLSRYVQMTVQYNAKPTGGLDTLTKALIAKIEDLYLNNQSTVVSNYGWDGVKIYNFKEYVDWMITYYQSKGLDLSTNRIQSTILSIE